MTFTEESGANAGDSLKIRVPVLTAVGQRDFGCYGTGGANCSNAQSYYAAEAPYYSSQACLRAFVLPRSGHVLNLHDNAPAFFAAVADWSDRFVRDRDETGNWRVQCAR